MEREREEEGNEMVVTIREVKTCERCGTERVLSENKEVTSIRSPEEVSMDAGATGDASAAAPGAASDADPGVGSDEGAARSEVSVGSAGAGDDSTPGADDPGATAFVESAEEGDSFEPPQSAEEDDGVILEDASPSERESPGVRADAEGSDVELDNPSTDVDVTADAIEAEEDETDDAELIDADEEVESGDGPVPWPEHDDVAEDTGEPAEREWPTAAGEDEGFDAEPSDGAPADVDFGGGLTPGSSDRTVGDANGAGGGFDLDGEIEEAFTGADGHTAELTTKAPDVDTEYYCPHCETTWPASESSMRAGDICRECRRGYVGEREL